VEVRCKIEPPGVRVVAVSDSPNFLSFRVPGELCGTCTHCKNPVQRQDRAPRWTLSAAFNTVIAQVGHEGGQEWKEMIVEAPPRICTILYSCCKCSGDIKLQLLQRTGLARLRRALIYPSAIERWRRPLHPHQFETAAVIVAPRGKTSKAAPHQIGMSSQVAPCF